LPRSLAPAHADALYNLGTLYGQDGRHEEALPLLVKAVSVKPENAMAWNNLGLVYYSLKRAEDAQRAFRLAASIDPSSAAAFANLAETEARLGDCAAARMHYAAALELGFPPAAAPMKNCR